MHRTRQQPTIPDRTTSYIENAAYSNDSNSNGGNSNGENSVNINSNVNINLDTNSTNPHIPGQNQSSVQPSVKPYPIRLTIGSGRRLLQHSLFKLPDPFVRIYVLDSKSKPREVSDSRKYLIYETKILQQQINPAWKEKFLIPEFSEDDSLRFEIWDNTRKDKGAKKGFLGSLELKFVDLEALSNQGFRKARLTAGRFSGVVEDASYFNSCIVFEIKSLVGDRGRERVPRIPRNLKPGERAVQQNRGNQNRQNQNRQNLKNRQNGHKLDQNSHKNNHQNHDKTLSKTGSYWTFSDWDRRTTDFGQIYYYNRSTFESIWNDPRLREVKNVPVVETLGQLPGEWRVIKETGTTYFANDKLKISQVTDPRVSRWLDTKYFHEYYTLGLVQNDDFEGENLENCENEVENHGESDVETELENEVLDEVTNELMNSVEISVNPVDNLISLENQPPEQHRYEDSQNQYVNWNPDETTEENMLEVDDESVFQLAGSGNYIPPPPIPPPRSQSENSSLISAAAPIATINTPNQHDRALILVPNKQNTTSHPIQTQNISPKTQPSKNPPQTPTQTSKLTPAAGLQTKHTKIPTATPVEDLPGLRSNLAGKLIWARKHLFKVNYLPQVYCHIKLDRADAFEQSYRQILHYKVQFLKHRLAIKFHGESGIDYGGLQREWALLITEKLFSPGHGLFEYTQDYRLHISPHSKVACPEHLSYFRFTGRLIGMSIYHGININCPLSAPIFKAILKKPITIDDLYSIDDEVYTNLKLVVDNNMDSMDLGLTFSVDEDNFGEHVSHDLKPLGRNLSVKENNKNEYVQLYARYKINKKVENQLSALMKGVYEIISFEQLRKVFDNEKELELALNGVHKIDVSDWQANTFYKNCDFRHKVVQWFWYLVEFDFDDEQRARLLQFCTGSSRVPLAGFQALRAQPEKDKPKPFSILILDVNNFDKDSFGERLPKAHTCFNRLDLPDYESYSKLKEKMDYCLKNTVGFGTE